MPFPAFFGGVERAVTTAALRRGLSRVALQMPRLRCRHFCTIPGAGGTRMSRAVRPMGPYRPQRASLTGPAGSAGSDPEGPDAAGADSAVTDAPPAARPVTRLIVGLGNPGDKYEGTRHNIGFDVLRAFAQSQLPLMAVGPGAGLGDGAAAPLPDFQFAKALQGDLLACDAQFRPPHAVGHGAPPDLADQISERRRERTLQEGVPFPLVRLLLLQPHTFMNRSGGAVRRALDHYQLKLKTNPLSMNRMPELLVVHDEVQLPFGSCQLVTKGGSGGQNGLRSIISVLRTERFCRLRVGVGPGMAHQSPKVLDRAKYVLDRYDMHERERLPVLLHGLGEVLRVYVHRGAEAAANVGNPLDLVSEARVAAFQAKMGKGKKGRPGRAGKG